MEKMFDFGNWWGCEIQGTDEAWYAVHAPPYMDAADAESWCTMIGGRELHRGGYMLAPQPGQTFEECMAEAQAICDALNERTDDAKPH